MKKKYFLTINLGELFWSWKHSSKQNKFPNLLGGDLVKEREKSKKAHNMISRSDGYNEGICRRGRRGKFCPSNLIRKIIIMFPVHGFPS